MQRFKGRSQVRDLSSVTASRYAALRSALAATAIAAMSGCVSAPALDMGSQQASTENVPIRAPYQTVSQEHRDRVRRLERLIDHRSDISMETQWISADEHGLSGYPIDIPVLRLVFDREVFFDVDESAVKPQAREILDIVAESLRNEPPDVALFAAGHTDATGSDNYNFNLGLRRAESVAASLVRRGVYQADVYRVSFGEHLPLTSNATSRGRAKNRRVEFLFAPRPEAIVAWLERQSAESCAARSEQELVRCKKEVKVVAQAVDVPKEHKPRVRQLARETERGSVRREVSTADSSREVDQVDSSRETDKASASRSKEAVEVSRKKIPVELSRKKYAIELNRAG